MPTADPFISWILVLFLVCGGGLGAAVALLLPVFRPQAADTPEPLPRSFHRAGDRLLPPSAASAVVQEAPPVVVETTPAPSPPGDGFAGPGALLALLIIIAAVGAALGSARERRGP